MLQWIAFAVIILCWVLWSLAFVRPSRQAADRKEVAQSSSSRWGIVLVMISFALLFTYVRPNGFHKSAPEFIAGILLAPPSVALAWAATRRLGKQWRYAAALREDHELITTGPYRRIRHPIYASMFGMLLATGLCWTWWPQFLASIVFFIAGTEVRIRAEDRLLESHFQDVFRAYRARTPAWIPFLR
ncbi:MAG TPA: isoprenylcysteine carboxylmethyltransferase family protein [Acidobacteriaceae bacterium]|nr:isoprenylcysteine carboxylmethyltransferase family protein [Acidobacteriaceae bacterium]